MLRLLSLFRKVALLEGASFIVLLGAAMPLKYLADLPQAVRVVGMAHGVLFIAYMLLLGGLFASGRFSARRTAVAFVVSLVPFGTFWFDKSLRAELLTPQDTALGS